MSDVRCQRESFAATLLLTSDIYFRGIMQTLWQDLRYGARMLLKKRGFTLVAVITLGLGTGAHTPMFSVINGTPLRPLPFNGPERLVHLDEKSPKAGMETMGFSF